MRFDLDTYKEILDTITRNKSRSLLTGFGVFWGVHAHCPDGRWTGTEGVAAS